ncbi:MAG TPA: Rieske 2Fe-2S domain-containing protein [Thermoanaerobaculia bacterium]|nr:Rieske 2Fe-2S domain-containing protein [Thermoanaerobaculia bacterium]
MTEIDRRRILGGAGMLIAAELASGACANGGGGSVKSGQIVVASSDLAGGRRVTVMVGENPVEVFREESGVTARLLRCTHTGCVVKWEPASRRYLCACHDGRFDENGNPVAGPPPYPLRLVPAIVDGERIVVG